MKKLLFVAFVILVFTSIHSMNNNSQQELYPSDDNLVEIVISDPRHNASEQLFTEYVREAYIFKRLERILVAGTIFVIFYLAYPR